MQSLKFLTSTSELYKYAEHDNYTCVIQAEETHLGQDACLYLRVPLVSLFTDTPQLLFMSVCWEKD